MAHLTRDLPQAENKNVVTCWVSDTITTIFTQNDNYDNFEWNSCHSAQLVTQVKGIEYIVIKNFVEINPV